MTTLQNKTIRPDLVRVRFADAALFGWGFWVWSIPALAFAVPAAVYEFRTAARRVTP